LGDLLGEVVLIHEVLEILMQLLSYALPFVSKAVSRLKDEDDAVVPEKVVERC
jgi:hypothetical protein